MNKDEDLVERRIDNHLQIAALALETDPRWAGNRDDFIALFNQAAEQSGLSFRASTWAEWIAHYEDRT